MRRYRGGVVALPVGFVLKGVAAWGGLVGAAVTMQYAQSKLVKKFETQRD